MYRQIVVPLDGSTIAEAALPLALALSRKTEATLHLVTVVEPIAAVAYPDWEALRLVRRNFVQSPSIVSKFRRGFLSSYPEYCGTGSQPGKILRPIPRLCYRLQDCSIPRFRRKARYCAENFVGFSTGSQTWVSRRRRANNCFLAHYEKGGK